MMTFVIMMIIIVIMIVLQVDDFDEGNTEQQGAFDKDGWATKIAEG